MYYIVIRKGIFSNIVETLVGKNGFTVKPEEAVKLTLDETYRFIKAFRNKIDAHQHQYQIIYTTQLPTPSVTTKTPLNKGIKWDSFENGHYKVVE